MHCHMFLHSFWAQVFSFATLLLIIFGSSYNLVHTHGTVRKRNSLAIFQDNQLLLVPIPTVLINFEIGAEKVWELLYSTVKS